MKSPILQRRERGPLRDVTCLDQAFPTLTEGTPANGTTVATFTDRDLKSGPGGYAAVINWGDGTTDAGVVIAQPSAGAFAIEGDHTHATPGNKTLAITVTNSAGAVLTISSTASVANAALSASGIAVNVLKGASTAVQVGTVSDGNAADAAGTHTVSINWGDSSSSSGSLSGSLGSFIASGTHTYAALGTYTVTTTVTDKDGGTATTTSTANVGDAFAGAKANLTASPFTQVSGGTPANSTATINWGDNSSSSGVVTGTMGNLTVTGNHNYAQDGTYTVTVTVTSSTGGSQTATGSVRISRGAVSFYGQQVATLAGQTLSNQLVAVVTDKNSNTLSSSYTSTINWGDGTPTSSGTITGSLGLFRISGSHTYSAPGAFTTAVLLGAGGTAVGGGQGATDAAVIGQNMNGPGVVPSRSIYYYFVYTTPFDKLTNTYYRGDWTVTHTDVAMIIDKGVFLDFGTTIVRGFYAKVEFKPEVKGSVVVKAENIRINNRVFPGPGRWFDKIVHVAKVVASRNSPVLYHNDNVRLLDSGAEMDKRAFLLKDPKAVTPWEHWQGRDIDWFNFQQSQADTPYRERQLLIETYRDGSLFPFFDIQKPIVTVDPVDDTDMAFLSFGIIQTATQAGTMHYQNGMGVKVGQRSLTFRPASSVDWYDPDKPGVWPWYGESLKINPPARVPINLSFNDSPDGTLPRFLNGMNGGDGTRPTGQRSLSFTTNIVSITSDVDATYWAPSETGGYLNGTWANWHYYRYADNEWYHDYVQASLPWKANVSVAIGNDGEFVAAVGVTVKGKTLVNGESEKAKFDIPTRPTTVPVNILPTSLTFSAPWTTWE